MSLGPHQLEREKPGLLGHQPNSPWMNQSGSAAAAVADQAFAVDPVAPPGHVLDPVIIAQPRRRRLAPPFGRDPLGPLDARNVMHRAPPHEPPRHAFGRRINDVDRFGPVEQALGALSPLSLRGEGPSRSRRGGVANDALTFPDALPRKGRGERPPPPTRSPARANGFPRACGRRTARGPSLTVSRSTSRASSRSPDGSSTRLSCAAPRSSVQSAVSANASKPNSGSSAAALSASSRCKCFGSRLGDRGRDRRDADAAVDAETGQRQPPRAEPPLLAAAATSSGISRSSAWAAASGWVAGSSSRSSAARRRFGGRGGQRLGLAAQRPVERIDHDPPPRETAAPAPAAARRSARRWS